MTYKTQTLMETMVSSEFALFGPNLWSSTFQSFSRTIHPLYSIKWGIPNANSLETMVSSEFVLIQKRKLAGNPATKPQTLWKPWFWAVLDEFAERKVCWKPSKIWGTIMFLMVPKNTRMTSIQNWIGLKEFILNYLGLGNKTRWPKIRRLLFDP